MKRSKKLLAALLAGIAAISLVACGDGGASQENAGTAGSADTVAREAGATADPAFEPYEEELIIELGRLASPHTLSSLYEGDTLENNPYTRYVKEKLNISFEDVIEANDEDYKKQISLAVASGDLPEIFTVTDYNTLVELVENDLVHDLTDVYEKYVCDYVRGVYDSFDGRCMDMVTFDGRLMALPGSNPDNSVPILCWMRKDWLDQLGLNPDKDGDLCISMEDIEEMAEAFVAADISGKGTVGIALADNVGDAQGLYGAMGGFADIWLKNEDGTIEYSTFADDSVKNTWELLNRWFEEGLLDPQFGTRTADDVNSLLINNQCGIAFGAWHTPDWRFTHVKDANPEAEYIAYTMKDADGKVNVYHENAVGNFVAVRKDYEHPEAAVKILNVVFGDLATATAETAPEVAQFMKDGGDNFCRPYQIEVIPYQNPAKYFTEHTAVMKGEMAPEECTTAENRNTSEVMMKYLENPEEVTSDTSAGWKAYNSRIVGLGASIGKLQENGNANWFSPLYPPTMPVMAQKKTTIDTLELQAYIKIVTGEEPISYFDQMKEAWYSNGGNEIIAELEAYYQD